MIVNAPARWICWPLWLRSKVVVSSICRSDPVQLQDVSWPILDLSADIHDYADTAALVSQLDLVIIVDTSVAHAAEALAKPAWVLLPHTPD